MEEMRRRVTISQYHVQFLQWLYQVSRIPYVAHSHSLANLGTITTKAIAVRSVWHVLG